MQSLMVIFIFSFFDWNLSPGPNLASILIRISISSGINFLCFRLEMPFSGKFFTKKKIQNCQFQLKFGTKLIPVCRNQWRYLFHLF